MGSAILQNITQVYAVSPGPIRLREASLISIIDHGAIVLMDDRIAWFGPVADAPAGPFDAVIDAAGGIVVPGLVDCHTHVVFAGSREREFVRKIQGASYLEILQSAGGIRSTMRSVRAASEDDLVAESLPRVRRMLECGVTTIECKSGYGLSYGDELKMLRAARRIAESTGVEIVGTYLAAHALPPEYDGRPDDYIDAMTDPSLLETLRREQLAEFADVFCEKGAFNLDQSRRFLTRCAVAGLTPKVHAEQLSHTGATRLAVDLAAASADHLEFIDDDDIASMKSGRTIPVLLPGCTFFLGGPPAPARKMIDAGLPVALATDCNPGSSMIESLPLIMSMACCLLKMTPIECLIACTANAAAAIRRADRIGAIAVGHQADLLILDLPNLESWPYRVGSNPVRTVIKRGQVVLDRPPT